MKFDFSTDKPVILNKNMSEVDFTSRTNEQQPRPQTKHFRSNSNAASEMIKEDY